ncbi:unannotated protein [freshwater metagenome]|uniref:Unannotated protein n=1 Tax=freshwater metagenome TaxID=449393 RepID=A0A6J7CP73_9ZZZZ|nr:sortase [Actinomycetota bacterium]
MTDAEEPRPDPTAGAGRPSPASALARLEALGGSKKLSRWDRPPDPHDWRWVVGNLGRTLITIGMLMFAFVGYQLWGTGIQEARSQDQLAQDFNQAIHDAGLDTTTTGTGTTPGTGTVSGTAVDTTPTTVANPAEQVFPTGIAPGDAIATIAIPAIGVNKYVVAGVSVKDLRKGVGHFPNTPFPGQLGNAAIAGHRTTYGQPFYRLDKLHKGDEIKISTILGGSYVYMVTSIEEVGKNDYHVISDSNPKKATLTLVTCTPIGTASRRLVVHAALDTARSSQVGKPTLYYGQEPSTVVTTAPPGETPAGGTAEGGSATAESVVPGSNLPATLTTTPGGSTSDGSNPDQAAGFNTPTDAFNQGWFADGRAWPHVIGWGLLLMAVCLGAYQLAKRQRRLWLGFLVGMVPFVVVLYFFFENVNRMLPAAI